MKQYILSTLNPAAHKIFLAIEYIADGAEDAALPIQHMPKTRADFQKLSFDDMKELFALIHLNIKRQRKNPFTKLCYCLAALYVVLPQQINFKDDRSRALRDHMKLLQRTGFTTINALYALKAPEVIVGFNSLLQMLIDMRPKPPEKFLNHPGNILLRTELLIKRWQIAPSLPSGERTTAQHARLA